MTPALAIATYLVLGIGLFGLFAAGERRIDGETRGQIGRWLSGERSGTPDPAGQPGDDWPRAFLAWFDGVFGVRAVRMPWGAQVLLPRLWRSVVASFLALLVLAVVWFLHKETLSRQIRFGDPVNMDGEILLLLVLYGGATLVTNWIPDYLSLIQSRWIMQRMSSTPRRALRLAWLGLDLLLTATIAFAAIYLGMRLLLPFVEDHLTVEIGCFSSATFGLDDAWTIFVAGLRFETPPATLNYDAAGIYIYSTFMTSLWVWIYLAVGFVVRAAAALGRRGEGPTQSAGLAAAPATMALRRRRPLLLMGAVALAAFTGVFWASWLQHGARAIDVAVVAPASAGARAEAMVRGLEAEGLRAAIVDLDVGDDDPALDARLAQLETKLDRAELVVVLEPAWPEPATKGAALMRLLAQQAEAGRRPRGSVRVSSLLPGSSPADEVAHAVSWAKRAPSLLGMEQIGVCRERGIAWGFSGRRGGRTLP